MSHSRLQTKSLAIILETGNRFFSSAKQLIYIIGLNSILFDQSLLHKYNIIEVGYDNSL